MAFRPPDYLSKFKNLLSLTIFTSIELCSEGDVTVPVYDIDPDIPRDDWRIEHLRHNGMTIFVPIKLLKHTVTCQVLKYR